jgi:hypothetical protein
MQIDSLFLIVRCFSTAFLCSMSLFLLALVAAQLMLLWAPSCWSTSLEELSSQRAPAGKSYSHLWCYEAVSADVYSLRWQFLSVYMGPGLQLHEMTSDYLGLVVARCWHSPNGLSPTPSSLCSHSLQRFGSRANMFVHIPHSFKYDIFLFTWYVKIYASHTLLDLSFASFCIYFSLLI